MKRRSFVKNSVITTAGFFITKDIMNTKKGPIYGHNEMTFRLDTKWGALNPDKTPVNDCHEMIQDAKGRILLLTNETKNNIIIYNKSGKCTGSWGSEFPGAHGLTVQHNGKEDFLFITDTNRHQVYKTTIDGKILFTIDPPADLPAYQKKEAFVPTETTVLPNGDFYIADGYGAQHILHYDENGKLKNAFGGRGTADENLDNAHGITVDTRTGTTTLIVTDRNKNCFKRFSLDGKLMEIIHLPGAGVCRPVIKGDYLYAAVLRSPMSVEKTGFVTILNKENKVVSNIGGTEPIYENNVLKPMAQADKIFEHPHDVCVDDEGNIYVAQWASGKVYPYKLTRA
jgi:hypothetical protein